MIKQIFTAIKPVYTVYKGSSNSYGEYLIAPAYYMALVENDNIVSISIENGRFERDDMTSNYIGLFSEDELKQFVAFNRKIEIEHDWGEGDFSGYEEWSIFNHSSI